MPKDNPFDLRIIRLVPLKGPERLLRCEVIMQLTQTYCSASNSSPTTMFEGDEIGVSLAALSEIVTALIWKHHRLDYSFPTEAIMESMQKMVKEKPDSEYAALMFLTKRRSLELSCRIWDRTTEYVRAVRNIESHYLDFLFEETDPVIPLAQLRDGTYTAKFDYRIIK